MIASSCITSIGFSGITGEDAVHGDEGVAVALTDNGTQRRKRKGRRTIQETRTVYFFSDRDMALTSHEKQKQSEMNLP